MSDCSGCPASSGAPQPATGHRLGVPKTVALVGPPNSGKTTLFNRLTGLRQKVANFPGVTVEHHVGTARLAEDREVELVDLPGVYSLQPRSEDERVAYEVLAGAMPGVGRPDAVLLVLDSTNLGRHLVLAAPILSMGLPALVVLNMADDLRARGGDVDTAALARQLGAPVVLISAAKGEGIETVTEFLLGTVAVPAPLELPVLQDVPRCRQWATRVGRRAGYQPPAPPLWTRRLDGVFLHPVAGPLVFLAVVVGGFPTSFSGARAVVGGVGV